MRRTRKLGLLSVLYLAQDTSYSFFLLAMLVILRHRGVSLERLALVNVLGLVWAGKFLLAPLVDRFGFARIGHYRGWLLAGHTLVVACLLALAPLDPVARLPLTLALVTVALLVSGLNELAANGLAVRLLAPAERGMVNSMHVAAISVSIVVGSSGSLLLYAHAGWAPTLCALSALYAVPVALLARFREPAPVAETGTAVATTPGAAAPREGAERATMLSLVTFARQAGVGRWMLIVPLYSCGVYVAEAVLSPMLVDAHWSLSRIALVQGTLGGLAGGGAAIGAGGLMGRFGRREVMLAFGLGEAALIVGLIPLAGGMSGMAMPDVAAAVVIVGLVAVSAAANAAVYTTAMDLARRESAAADVAFALAPLAVMRLAANAAGLAVAGVVGYPPLLAAAAVATAGGALAAGSWARRHHPALLARAADVREAMDT